MKFNKWTVALAAVGVVSLASAAKAEEKAVNAVQTALSATTISGYVDTSAQWNFGTGNENSPPYKFGGPGKADGFNLNVVQLRIEKPLDESEWAAGYKVDLWFGPDANSLHTLSTAAKVNEGSGYHDYDARDFAVRQAYVNLRMPLGNGLDWKIGVFDSILGYESVEAGNNPNYTRSYGHSIEPQTHTGVLASYRFSDMISASAGVANTIGPSINQRAFPGAGTDGEKAESFKSYMGSIAVTAPDSMGFLSGSTLYGGIVTGYNEDQDGADLAENTTSYYAGATIATPVTGLRFGAAFDYLDVHYQNYHNVGVWTLGLYGSFQATEKLSLHLRGEYLHDSDDVDFFYEAADNNAFGVGGSGFNVYALTATAQYDLWKNVVSRLEFRWDHAEHGNTFGANSSGETGSGGSRANAFMLAANVIYKF